MGIRSFFEDVACGFHHATGLRGARLVKFSKAALVFGSIAPLFDRVEAHVGLGGTQTFTPWIGLFRYGARPQTGIYPVYFLSAAGSYVVLSLQFGTEHLAMAQIENEAVSLRSRLTQRTLAHFEPSIDLEHNGYRQRKYVTAHLVGRSYLSCDLPSESDLVEDLRRMETALTEAVFGGGRKVDGTTSGADSVAGAVDSEYPHSVQQDPESSGLSGRKAESHSGFALTPSEWLEDLSRIGSEEAQGSTRRADVQEWAASVPVSALGLQIRTVNALRRGGVDTVDDLVRQSPGDLTKIAHFGDGCLEDVIHGLARRGLELSSAPTTVDAGPRWLEGREFSVRARNIFNRYGIFTVADLGGLSESRLRELRNLGAKVLAEIRGFLAALGLELADPRVRSLIEEPLSIDSLVEAPSHLAALHRAGVRDTRDMMWLPLNKVSILGSGESSKERKKVDERVLGMVEQRRAGDTFDEIAKRYGITRERVRQLIAKVPGSPTAREARDARKARKTQERIDRCARQMAEMGLSHGQISEAFFQTFSVRSAAKALGLSREAIEWSLEQSNIDYALLNVSSSEPSYKWADEQILEYLRLAHEGVGEEYLSYVAYEAFAAQQNLTPEAWPSPQRIMQRYEKWAYACEAAGIPFREVERDRRFTEVECLKAVAQYLGECRSGHVRPTFTGYDGWAKNGPDRPSGATVRNRISGTWRETLVQANHFVQKREAR